MRDAMREQFEKKHPVPDFVIWNPSSQQYQRSAFVSPDARNAYRQLWDEWKVSYALEGRPVEVKTADLTGAALDWAVAMVEGYRPDPDDHSAVWSPKGDVTSITVRGAAEGFGFRPSADWGQGGPLLDARVTALNQSGTETWWARSENWLGIGETPLIAACRAIVAAKLGDTVSIPRGLIHE